MKAFGAVLLAAAVLSAGTAVALEPAPPAVPAPEFNERWQGAYAIVLMGKGWANIFNPQSSGLAWTAGTVVGYSRRSGHFVLGVEGTGMWSGREGTFYDIPWTSDLRLRWGVAGEDFHFYGAGGVAVMHFNNTIVAPFSSTELGWTIGAGLDIAAGNHFVGRVEYLYSRYGDLNGTTNLPLATHEIRWGVGARF